MNTLDSLRDLDVPVVTTLVLVAWAATVVALDPVLGHRQFGRLVDGLDTAVDEPERDVLRRRLYRSWTWQGWSTGAIAVAAVLVLPGVGPGDLGLRLPDLSGLDLGDATATVAGAAVGLALAIGAIAFVRRRSPGTVTPPNAVTVAMMPTTAAARRGWAGLSFSAGVTEEITYRGLVVLALTLTLPSLDHGALVAVAAVLFGVAHWYQGWLGMLATGVLGAALTQLYLSTGSLLLPMLLHVLIDLRLLLDRPAPTEAARLAAAR